MTDQTLVIETTELLQEQVTTQELVELPTSFELLEAAVQGPPGPRGPVGPAGGSQTVPVGAAPLSGHSVVAVGADGALIAADCTAADQQGRVYAMLADAYSAGTDAVVQTSGPLEFSGWSWTPGLPLVVGTGGQLTHSLPLGATFSQTVAYALSPTRILIDIQPPISIAT